MSFFSFLFLGCPHNVTVMALLRFFVCDMDVDVWPALGDDRCKDKNGPFLVETTAWEGKAEEPTIAP